ncbi:MAG: hypothetical protein PUJ82_06120 [Spirochaetales bacterium]|nr:hypothetical protein [Spirochaetia bacterium]MDD7610471.1 hypothetical protein [Spirochaetales bacterium]MDY5916199.1 hypothetical protein [Treponema sp.]
MGFFTKKQVKLSAVVFNLNDFEELNYNQLVEVNGGCGGGFWNSVRKFFSGEKSSSSSSSSDSSASRGSSGYSSSSPSGSTSYTTSSSNGGCGGNINKPSYTKQREFSSKYGEEFGNHACAATSLLNEISEQYTKETGKKMTQAQKDAAMAAAVNSGSVDTKNAFVNSWDKAANDMANAVGLTGKYRYTTDSSKASATIYALDNKENGFPDHFVNSTGNGQYFDPWNGKTENVAEKLLATEGLGGTRDLIYSK